MTWGKLTLFSLTSINCRYIPLGNTGCNLVHYYNDSEAKHLQKYLEISPKNVIYFQVIRKRK